MDKTIWHKGKPPHDGWWCVRTNYLDEVGQYWSFFFNGLWHRMGGPEDSPQCLWAMYSTAWRQKDFEWCDYWPENARVPRINPNEEQK